MTGLGRDGSHGLGLRFRGLSLQCCALANNNRIKRQ